jgi:hypothetical protein
MFADVRTEPTRDLFPKPTTDLGTARRLSAALAATAAVTSAASFTFWEVFHRDVPMTIGNMRGTVLTMLVLAVPLLVGSMSAARAGSMRARFVWLAVLAYIAYNAVMLLFGARFNSFFLLFAALLALSFWSLVSLFRTFDADADAVRASTAAVPVRSVAVYLWVCAGFFALAWLREVVPATLANATPAGISEAGMTQNPVWVLDFAFTFPLMTVGGIWLWHRRSWGFVVGGMMTLMLTLETISIGVDQWFGHLHAPSASLAALPMMALATVVGALFSVLFLRAVRA